MPPPIYQLNHPPHPFWDFVQEMNEHPFWRGAPRPGGPPPPPQRAEPAQPEVPRTATAESNQTNEQIAADDPPEVDPSTLKGDNCRHQRRCARRCGRDQRGGFREGGPQAGGWPFFGPPPFAMGGGPFGGEHGHRGPNHPHHPHHPSPPPFGFRGRGGHHHRGGPGCHRGGPRGHHHGHQSAPQHPGFNLGKFLNDLGDRIGVDLSSAAEGLGIDRFMPSNANSEVDFEPKVDIFDLADQFLIHASLPGAKKEDVGVDWDGEHSLLRLAGVVHRPEVDEEILQQLAVDGRKREVGVFEKAIRLGTIREPASIDVSGIKAKMADGVLVVRVPKIEKEHRKRDVPISSATPSPPRYNEQFEYEDYEMYDAAPENFQHAHPVLQPERSAAPPSRNASANSTPPPPPNKVDIESEKQAQPAAKPAEDSQEAKKVDTKQEKQAEPAPQAAPSHQAVSHEFDSDSDSISEEGEYVKINVD